jgi:hypothetical protein
MFGKTKELKQFINSGYHQVSLWINKKQCTFYMHRLVAEIYNQNPNNLPEVDHRDSNKSNNHISNLEWVTTEENKKRAKKNGLMIGPLGFKHSEDTKLKMSINRKGEKHGRSKLTEKDVLWIRQNYIPRHEEFGSTALSKKFNIRQGQISSIIKRVIWKHI